MTPQPCPVCILEGKEVPMIYKGPTGVHSIPLSRKKVKKWYIEITTLGGPVINTKEAYTDEEIRKIMDVFPYVKVRRVKEIEVDAE